MIPDFFGQQQSALRTGLQMGQAMNQYDLQQQQEQRAQQQFEQQQRAAEQDYQQSMQQALQRNMLSDTAFLLSMDEADQNKLIPSLKRKYRGNDTLKTQIEALERKPYKERMVDLYEIMAVMKGAGAQGQTAGTREREQLLRDLESDDPDRAASARIALGLGPRATGSAAQTIAAQGTAEDVAAVKATIAGAEREAEKAVDLAIQPEIEMAVTNATNAAKAVAKSTETARSNAKAFNVYETGIRKLEQSLAGADTGPIVGRLPAFTANQQIAEGAVAAMAPILKQMFRSAGEGSFTDKDQEMLLNMIPTRKTRPEAVAAQLSAIDAIVKAKLSIEDEEESATPPTGGAVNWGDL